MATFDGHDVPVGTDRANALRSRKISVTALELALEEQALPPPVPVAPAKSPRLRPVARVLACLVVGASAGLWTLR